MCVSPLPPPLTNTLASLVKTDTLKPTFYPYLQIGRLLSNGKDALPPLSKSGVYLLRCRDCPAIYIGECGRAFRVRISDHVDAFLNNNNPLKSAFAKHLLDENHIGGEEEILHIENNYRKRLALESIETTKYQQHHERTVLNRSTHNDNLITEVFARSPHYSPFRNPLGALL